MSGDLENTNYRTRRVRWVMLGAAAALTLSCSSSTDVQPGAGGEAVAAVIVTPPASTIMVGAQLPLQAQVQDATGKTIPGASIVWSVRDTAIASVSPIGVVTARAVGATQVAASSNGRSGIAAITVQKTPVASVVVRPPHVDAIAGSKTQLTAIAYDAAQNALAERPMIWTTSNAGVATVDVTGLVTAVAAGSATITATSEGKSDAATVSIVQGAVASVVIVPDTVSMVVAQTTQLAATTRDAFGGVITGSTIIWSSSNSVVASVSSTGLVTALGPGTATITATSDGHSATAAVTVTTNPVASVSISPSAVTLAPNGTTTLTATTRDANGIILTNRAVTWSSSNTQVATVNSFGGVAAGGLLGTATITATSEGKTGTASVTVAQVPVGSVTVSPATASVSVGQTTSLTATVKDANGGVLTGRTVTWASSNTAFATVSAAGVVTGVAAGPVTITATSEGKSGTAAVTVVVPVGSVIVAPNPGSVLTGQTVTLTATVKDQLGSVVTDRVVTWTSSNSAVATVSSTGVVTGVAPGPVTITATSETKFGTASVTVTLAPVASVTVSPPTANVVIAGTTALTAVVRDVNGTVVTRAVTWSSSDPTKATVSSGGVVTGVAVGLVNITATSEGKSGSSAVTVTLAPVASVTVAPPTASVASGSTTTFTATLKDANGNVLTGRTVTWVSGNTPVATVSPTGVATGLLVGTATITATSEGVPGSGSVTVTPGPLATVQVTPSSASIPVLGSVQLTAKALDAHGNTITTATFTWQSSNSTVATVAAVNSTTGSVSGVKAGTATITATTGTKSGTSAITVTP